MPGPAPILTRGPRERALAWLYTGPLGHLWSAVADITTLWLIWAVPRVRARVNARIRPSRTTRA